MYSAFQKKIAAAARVSFEDLLKTHKDEVFYTFCLYTDSDAWTVVPSANSQEGLLRILERYKVPVSDAESIPQYKWSPEEWDYCAWKKQDFQSIGTELRSSPDREDFSSFVERVHVDMVSALKLLDEEGLFGSGSKRENVILFCSISDDNDALAFEDESARQLNSPEACREFLDRYKGLL